MLMTTGYVLMAAVFFTTWLNILMQENLRRHSGQESPVSALSVAVLAIATVFWPIVVPIAYLELLNRATLRREEEAIAQRFSLSLTRLPELPKEQATPPTLIDRF